MRTIVRSTLANGWPLFWFMSLPMIAFMVIAMLGYDLSKPEDVSHMISYSVRWGVPFICAVVAASAMPKLFPSEFTRWWSRNRRYIGLTFAVAMAWQGLFIFMMSNLHTDYYYDEVYYLRDELEGSSGYLFLAAMVLTSFQFGRRFVSNSQWKVLHRSGVYFLWAYPYAVYWWNVFYYDNPRVIDYCFYWATFLAFAARIAAWGKGRASLTADITVPALERFVGAALIVLGIIASATGSLWQQTASQTLLAPAWSANLELWLPFWPFVSFLPLIALGIGTWIFTGSIRQPSTTIGRTREKTSLIPPG